MSLKNRIAGMMRPSKVLFGILPLVWLFGLAGPASSPPLYLRMIVVPSRPQAEKLWRQLETGQDFAKLARLHSIDPNAARGGYLGQVDLEKLSQAFRRTAGALEAGHYSRPFRSGTEYFILYRLPRNFRQRSNALLEEGNRLLEEQHLKEAIERYRRALDVFPDFAQGYFRLGVAYGMAGRHGEEEKAFQRAVEIAPRFHQAHYNLGRIRMNRGDLAGAILSFQRALEIRPDQAAPWVNLSAIYQKLGRRSEALEAARKAVEINPLLAGAYYNLGLAYGLDDLEKALFNFKMAATIDPHRLEARMNVAVALSRLGRTREAAATLEKILAEHPDLEAARKMLARLREAPPRASAGREAKKTSPPAQGSPTAAHPLTSDRYAGQAREALRRGDLERAIQAYRQALKLAPDSKQLRQELDWTRVARGKELQSRGRWGAALKTWKEVLKSTPSFLPALAALARALTIEGDFTAAERYLRKAEQSHPDNPEVIILRSRLAYERRDIQASVGELERLKGRKLENQDSLRLMEQLLYLDLDDQALTLLDRLQLPPLGRLQAASILIKFSKYAAAEKILTSLDSASSDLLLARLYMSQLRFKEAETLFSKLIRQDASNWAPLYFLGEVYLESGRAEKAIEVLERAHRLEPHNVNILYKLGQSCRKAGRAEEAARWLKQGLALEPDAFQLNFELGETELNRGKRQEALRHLLKVLEPEPDHIRTHYLLGRLYQEEGNLSLARRYLTRFQQLKRSLEAGRKRLLEKKAAIHHRKIVL